MLCASSVPIHAAVETRWFRGAKMWIKPPAAARLVAASPYRRVHATWQDGHESPARDVRGPSCLGARLGGLRTDPRFAALQRLAIPLRRTRPPSHGTTKPSLGLSRSVLRIGGWQRPTLSDDLSIAVRVGADGLNYLREPSSARRVVAAVRPPRASGFRTAPSGRRSGES